MNFTFSKSSKLNLQHRCKKNTPCLYFKYFPLPSVPFDIFWDTNFSAIDKLAFLLKFLTPLDYFSYGAILHTNLHHSNLNTTLIFMKINNIAISNHSPFTLFSGLNVL